MDKQERNFQKNKQNENKNKKEIKNEKENNTELNLKPKGTQKFIDSYYKNEYLDVLFF
tara:strand:+ start:55 stop:228 length:174 start_codon:yes stop_codon:yes gene_type:complete